MPRKKTTPRKANEFVSALKSAKKNLAVKIKERDKAVKFLWQLNVDIPNLERTCRALEAQLGSTGPDSRPTSQTVSKQVGEVLPSSIEPSDIPPEIRAQLPPEDFSKFGSHFGEGPAEKEDFLPVIEGDPVIPEKK